jgi:hypothetical protein
MSYLKTLSVPRSKHTASIIKKTSRLMLYKEIIAVCSQIRTKHIKTQFVSRSKHSASVINTSQLMLYREIIGSQIHTKHIKNQSVPRSKHTPPLL